MKTSDTARKILDSAQDMIRRRGFGGFSYADVADQVGIRKASIHYHFPSKGELARELVLRYREQMTARCDAITRAGGSPRERLARFAGLYREGLDDGMICMCAMLAADLSLLPEWVGEEVQAFFGQVVEWLRAVLQEGADSGIWKVGSRARDEARALLALLQGSQLLARSASRPAASFDEIVLPALEQRYPPD